MLLSHDALISVLFCETDRAQRVKTPLSVLYFGINHAEELRSRPGRVVFERGIGEVVGRVSRVLRCYDSLGRMAEAEFVILLPGCTSPNAVTFAERLNSVELRTPVLVDETEFVLAACFGVTQSGGRSPLIVLREAQQAFQKARTNGANSVELCRTLEFEAVLSIPAAQDEIRHW